MILQVQSITKFYKKFKAIEDISFSIKRGQVVGFVGANGAGKSTTLKAILNFHSISKGSITLFGKPHTEKAARERLGFLAEHPYFYDGLTATEFLVFYGRLSGLTKVKALHRAEELLERVGLLHVKSKLMREFSKGMNQRMGIAQALVHEPEFIILDEPMSGLDPMGRLDVRTILQDLKSQGKTIFFSSHILPDVEAICDDVILIHKGRLVRDTTGEAVLRSSVKYFEWTVSGLSQEQCRKIFPQARYVGVGSGQVVVHFEDLEPKEALSAHKKIVEAKGNVVRISPFRESLEDVMFRLSRGEIQ